MTNRNSPCDFVIDINGIGYRPDILHLFFRMEKIHISYFLFKYTHEYIQIHVWVSTYVFTERVLFSMAVSKYN